MTVTIELRQADCLDFLEGIPDDSVDLVATDPPYYRVKEEGWDRQWDTKAAFFAWMRTVLAEYHRVLKPTGSIYLFAGPHLATQVELAVDEQFRLLNHIVWCKPTGRHMGCRKEDLRKYFPQTEHIMFAESRKPATFVYEPIRAYLDAARESASVPRSDVDRTCGVQMAGHWFGRSQWSMPSRAHYDTMNSLFGRAMKPYDELFQEYKALKEAKRHFAVSKHVPYTNVWGFKPVAWYPGKHPCEKPAAMMEHIIVASSRPGDTVMDTFAGSGSTALACQRLGRHFIGCEKGDQEFVMATARLRGTRPPAEPERWRRAA